MAIIKCKMCGGDIELSPDKTFGICEYCGSTMTLPKIDDEQRAAAFNRGNHFRRIGEFDKALSIYERIVQEDENDAEAHWCCALCRFGIEYVEDPTTYEWLPTCHRLSFDSFLEDVDYLAALEHSDGITRRQYQKDGAKIAEVQRGILATSQNTEPYDVFICYKETDDSVQRTRDSILAQDIYYQLTEQGRRVFFARITLEDVPGAEYEPYIFAALNSAKVMVVVGTSGENLNAAWVKNEWSRFLALMKKDRSKLLIPCFRDMDPYDLPEQLSVLQSYDMGKIGFIQDLLRGVGKVLDAGKKTEVKERVIVQQPGNSNIEALLKRGQMALEDGDWAKADGFFEDVLNQDAENARAYIGKALVEERQPNLGKLAQARLGSIPDVEPEILTIAPDDTYIEGMMALAVPGYYEKEQIQEAYASFDRSYPSQVKGWESQRQREEQWWRQHKDLSRAARFAKGGDKKELEQARNQVLNELDRRIAQAKNSAEEATVEDRYRAFLEETGNDVREKIVQAQKQREQDYLKFRETVHISRDISALGRAAAALDQLHYKDSASLASEAREKMKKYQREQDARTYKYIAVFAALLVVCLVVALIVTQVILPAQKYRNAEALLAAGDKAHAAVAFGALGSFLDAKERSVALWDGDSISAGQGLTVGLKPDGTVMATGYNDEGQCDVSGWTDIVSVSAGRKHTVGLKPDGTVVAVGNNRYHQCDTSDWTDIIAVSAGAKHTVGLKSDGTVVAVGDNIFSNFGLLRWTDIVAVSAGYGNTVGLKADGTVVADGGGYGKVSGWKDIVAVSAGGSHTVGLKADGTVVAIAIYYNDEGQCDVSGWTDIAAVSAGYYHTVGLKSDGTVVAVGNNRYHQCDVSGWTDIVAISAGDYHTVGLKADGTVVATGKADSSWCDVSDWENIKLP